MRRICLTKKILEKYETVKILAPINSFEGAIKVIDAGADEIYCGVIYPDTKYQGISTRINKCSLNSYDELERVVKYAHNNGVKAIVTLEFPYMSELLEKRVNRHINSCAEKDIDAFIIGDIGLFLKVNKMNLDIPIHASTYFASMNYEEVDFLKKLGAERVILERQVSIEEIAQIVKSNKDIEIEVFVHGSGCSNININCYGCYTPEAIIQSIPNKLSTKNFESYQNFGFITPSNKFKMISAPMCRLTFEIEEMGNKEKTYAPILDAYTFCSLCMLPMLVKTGVTGFKIVDRCQTKEYQETCTRVYRELTTIIEQGQIKLFQKKLNSIKKNHTDFLFPNFPEACEQRRCYYSPFFYVPYKIPRSKKNSQPYSRSVFT